MACRGRAGCTCPQSHAKTRKTCGAVVVPWVITQAANASRSIAHEHILPLAIGRTCTRARPQMIAVFTATPTLHGHVKMAECHVPLSNYIRGCWNCADGSGGRIRAKTCVVMISRHINKKADRLIRFVLGRVSHKALVDTTRGNMERVGIGLLDTKSQERATPTAAVVKPTLLVGI